MDGRASLGARLLLEEECCLARDSFHQLSEFNFSFYIWLLVYLQKLCLVTPGEAIFLLCEQNRAMFIEHVYWNASLLACWAFCCAYCSSQMSLSMSILLEIWRGVRERLQLSDIHRNCNWELHWQLTSRFLTLSICSPAQQESEFNCAALLSLAAGWWKGCSCSTKPHCSLCPSIPAPASHSGFSGSVEDTDNGLTNLSAWCDFHTVLPLQLVWPLWELADLSRK